MNCFVGKVSALTLRVNFPGYQTLAPWVITVIVPALSKYGVQQALQCRAVIDDFGDLVPVTEFS